MALFLISLIALISAVMLRRRSVEALGLLPHPEAFMWARDAVCVFLASLLACLALEAWNSGMGDLVFMYARHEFAMVFVIMAICYVLAFRSGWLMSLAAVVATFVGVAEHYTWKFRGTPVIPADVTPSTLGTAGEVAGGYDFTPDEVILVTLAFGILAIAVSVLVARPKGSAGPKGILRAGKGIRDFAKASPKGAHVAPKTGTEDDSGSDADKGAEDAEEVVDGLTEAQGASQDVPAYASDAAAVPDAPTGEERATEMPLEADDVIVIRDDIAVIGDGEGAEPVAVGLGSEGSDEDEADAEEEPAEAAAAEETDADEADDKGDGEEKAVGMKSRPRHLKSTPRHLSDSPVKVTKSRRKRAFGFASVLASPLLTIAISVALVFGASFFATFDYEEGFPSMFVDWWQITNSYKKQGTIPTFAYLLQTTRVEEPDGWDEESAQATYDEMVASYAHEPEKDGVERDVPTGSEMPDVIGIMNESHCDMTVYDRLELPIEAAPQYVRSDAPEGIVESGRTRVSVFGGQTANSEYEFLTGDSMLALGMSTVPYAQYNLSEAPSIARQLSELGYGTYAIHPCDANNWDRNLRYPELGFDEFRSIDDFEKMGLDDTFHGAISDRMCYQMALSILDEREDADEPTFIWDVTMQNHGGYDKDNLPEESVVDYDLSMLSGNTEKLVREYMSCAEESTDATMDLLAVLEERDRPTIVVFYGDHQPVCNSNVIDEIYSDIDSNSVGALKHQTSYFIWENKAMREGTSAKADEVAVQAPAEEVAATETEEASETEATEEAVATTRTRGLAAAYALSKDATYEDGEAAPEAELQGEVVPTGEEVSGQDSMDASGEQVVVPTDAEIAAQAGDAANGTEGVVTGEGAAEVAYALSHSSEDKASWGTAEGDEETAPLEYRPREEIGVNMLSARLMERIGYPLTDFQKFVLALRAEARSTCLMGMVRTEDYHWVPVNEKEMPEPLAKLRDVDWLVVDRHIAFS